MDKIASFQVDHTRLRKGMYISRIDGDVITYDIRTRTPNQGNVMENDAIHTLEHLIATYVRNSASKDAMVYFGPMGCRTGFYLLIRDSVSHADAISLVRQSLAFVLDYEGEIPGSTEAECGNFREHSLPKAKAEAREMLSVLKDWTSEKLDYGYPGHGPASQSLE